MSDELKLFDQEICSPRVEVEPDVLGPVTDLVHPTYAYIAFHIPAVLESLQILQQEQ